MKNRIARIALLHHVGGGNLGDDATLDAVMDNIRLRWPDVDLEAYTMNPADTERRHGLRSYPLRRKLWASDSGPADAGLKQSLRAAIRKDHPLLRPVRAAYRLLCGVPRSMGQELAFLWRSWNHIRRSDLLIVCGGGQLTERDGPWAFPYTLFKWLALARLAGLRCVFLNVGAGPLTSWLGKKFSAWSLSLAHYVTFRDQKSQALARRAGYRGPSQVYPDLAYSIDMARVPLPRALGESRAVIGVAPVPWADPRLHPAEKTSAAYEEFLEKCAAIIVSLSAAGHSVVLFGTDAEVDARVSQDLLAAAGSRGVAPLPVCERCETVEDVLTSISRMDYVITCRFHGVIFAQLLNKPVLAIAHHPKVSELMNTMGLGAYCLDIGRFSAEQAADRFASLIRNAAAVKSQMAESLFSYRHILTAQLDELLGSLPSSDISTARISELAADSGLRH